MIKKTSNNKTKFISAVDDDDNDAKTKKIID